MPIGVAFRSLMAAGAGGAAAAWAVIDSTTLGSASASISFATGLSGYKLFRVTAYFVKDATNGSVRVRLNNDSGTNYDVQRLYGSSTTVGAGRSTGQTGILLNGGGVPQASQTATAEVIVAKQVAGSASMVLGRLVYQASGPVLMEENTASRWNNTADLISRIDLIATTGNFDTGTVAVLEGVPD